MSRAARALAALAFVGLVPAVARPQSRPQARPIPREPAAMDSVRADSARRAQALAAMRVEVTRTPAAPDRVPWAVATQDARALRRGQATVGVDEALGNVPGVIVSNRYNYALDQRLAIRGAGSRANFGLRGVKVLLDGVPQSLPDGQSQLTNIDLAAMGRVEVLRGAASSLYGNGSGGVLAFSTDLSAPDPLGASVRATGGSFGLAKLQARVSGRAGATVGAASASRTTVDGFRQYSRADLRQLSGAVDHLAAGITWQARAGVAETPTALNPGALTPAEFAVRPESAAANNVRRGARRSVSQRFASLRAAHDDGTTQWSAAVFGQRRFVDNPLATAPPAPAAPTNGTRGLIDRRVTGMRLDAARSLGGAWAAQLAVGLDVQRAHDVRTNQRTTAGRTDLPSDTVFVRQAETVTSIGPSAQLRLAPTPRLTVSLGARGDRIGFRVDDAFLADGDDDSGARTMSAASGHLGAVWALHVAFAPYANVATAFETPTTTELNAREDGAGGFNGTLGPQRIRSVEVGARGRAGTRVAYEVAVFDSRASDAIVQFLESGGRAFFRNAGRTRTRGAEIGVTAALTGWLTMRGAYTRTDATFTDYAVPAAALPAPALDTLSGNRLAGIPDRAWRVALQLARGGASLDVEHSWQGAAWGDDRNSVRVADWGRGQLNVRAVWSTRLGGWRLEPFAALQNALDERYVGAVTLNGFGGRVLEPAPGRNWYVGVELAHALVRSPLATGR
ncbi:MAG: TonB-dependent receptor [Gemmatimonadaceae bacterium]|nr:TonB-dependent receptor [Gemmatimonadaceae bacterium]